MAFGVFIGIVYIVQAIGGMYASWCFHLYCRYHAKNLGDLRMSVGVFIGIVNIMQTIGGCISVGAFICIVYFMSTIWGIYVSWYLHWYCIYYANNSYELYILCQQFMGIYVSWCFYWYCIYHANNLGDVCQLVFSFVLYILCQQFWFWWNRKIHKLVKNHSL